MHTAWPNECTRRSRVEEFGEKGPERRLYGGWGEGIEGKVGSKSRGWGKGGGGMIA